MITVIGATNIDIIATTQAAFVAKDSNPSKIVMSIGGVAKNYAHNLSLLGEKIQFITLFGNDYFGDVAKAECHRLGFDIHLSDTPKDSKSSMFMCINNPGGIMQAGAADVDIVERFLTPDFLAERMHAINQSDLVLFDANLSSDAIAYLIDHCSVPLMADTVSTKKAIRLAEALQKAEYPHLHTLKMNEVEAQYILTSPEVEVGGVKQDKDLEHVVTLLLDLGVENIYITMGEKGVYCRSTTSNAVILPTLPNDNIVDTNGAGDAFLSGVAYAFLRGIVCPEAAHYGQHAANATLSVASTVNPNLREAMLPLITHIQTYTTKDNEQISVHIAGGTESPF